MAACLIPLLRDMIAARSMNVYELADRAGKSRQRTSNILCGRGVSLNSAADLMRAMDPTEDEIAQAVSLVGSSFLVLIGNPHSTSPLSPSAAVDTSGSCP